MFYRFDFLFTDCVGEFRSKRIDVIFDRERQRMFHQPIQTDDHRFVLEEKIGSKKDILPSIESYLFLVQFLQETLFEHFTILPLSVIEFTRRQRDGEE